MGRSLPHGRALTLTPQSAEQFIRANTAVAAPPHVPEISLHLASEAHDLWLKTEEELREIGLPPPFWAFAWAGGQALARYLLDHPETAGEKRVVDFATGSGLVAIAAHMAGARTVLGADIDPFSETAFCLNTALNGANLSFTTRNLIGEALDADLLLAGDVFFDRELAQSLLPWFENLTASGITVLVGDPGRSYLPRDRLSLLATYEVPVSRALEDAEIKRTSVWRFISPSETPQ
ncbi:MAG: methyltransferase [Methylobacterium mesophilicum]|nr:methyltransferase [Methylobacterium mesophilicum]